MKTVISFDLYADMGFLKKPDINEKIYLTYNMLHKPCLLGILGAIVGQKGFTKNNEFPEYYKKLKNIPVGIKPIGKGCEQGNFTKNVTTYANTIGFANADGNLIVSEQTLIHPAFRIFLLLNLEKEDEQTLYNRIWQQEASFIPYLGKNDYSAWWYKEDVKEYSFQEFKGAEEFQIETVFIKEDPLVNQVVEHQATFRNNLSFLNGSFMYFEKLPIGYNSELYQYDYADFAYTDWRLSKDSFLPNLYKVDNLIVQLN
ncbi:MAG: type I-B CRISPR-associated protein Cas5b [Porphyromonadaceae bacterium]|nr:type I-B CRISPR-associated protein Cas5b [Porphyromonadaceae bacterium]